MASNLKSVQYEMADAPNEPEVPGWFRVAFLAAGSALLGGLAAAWFYRKTLARMRQAENMLPLESPANDDGDGI